MAARSPIRGGHVRRPPRLTVAQQRLQRAQRGSKNRAARRETVAARHRKIANRRKDFHHKQPANSRPATTCWWWRTSRSPICCAAQSRSPIRTTRGSSSPTAPERSLGSTDQSVTLAGVSSSRYCAPKRKTLGAPGSRSTPGTPPTGVSAAATQHPRIASAKRNSPANAAVTPHRQMNTLHVTSSGLDWPYTPHPRRRRSRRLPAVGEVTWKK